MTITFIGANLAKMNHISLVADESERRVEAVQHFFHLADVVERLSVRDGVDQEKSVRPVEGLAAGKLILVLFRDAEQRLFRLVLSIRQKLGRATRLKHTFGQVSRISKRIGSESTRTSFLYLVSAWWSYSPMYLRVRNLTVKAAIVYVMTVYFQSCFLFKSFC